MPNTLQDFLTHATKKAASDLADALLSIPEDKRNWSPADKARTALDQAAECAILSGSTANLIQTRKWPEGGVEVYFRTKEETIAKGWEHIHTLLQENTQKVVAAISAVPEDELSVDIELPWGKQPLAEILSYPYWNMSYHLGQINYIASILGCLK